MNFLSEFLQGKSNSSADFAWSSNWKLRIWEREDIRTFIQGIRRKSGKWTSKFPFIFSLLASDMCFWTRILVCVTRTCIFIFRRVDDFICLSRSHLTKRRWSMFKQTKDNFILRLSFETDWLKPAISNVTKNSPEEKMNLLF